ncbi:MAG: hypothetical protein FWH36_02260 [Lentimicrobiaceae bacterium]|nr:hypothetical protein [Lentimicrobiaceae bacterium]
MDSSNVSLDRLNEHLFDVIEWLKDRSDPEADKKDIIDLETAAQICDASKIIVDFYKVKAQVLNIVSKCSDPQMIARFVSNTGIAQIPERTPAELARERELMLYK